MHTIPNIAPFRDKLSDLNEQMADPDFYSDQRRATEVSREQMRLSTLVEKFEAYYSTVEQLKENQAMAADNSVEAELREMAAEEIEPLANERDRLANDVLRFMIPPDATDSRNSVMEIRGVLVATRPISLLVISSACIAVTRKRVAGGSRS